MKQILLLILLTASNDVLAQERIDTLYYNRSGSVVPSPAFAEYYRIALYPADSAGSTGVDPAGKSKCAEGECGCKTGRYQFAEKCPEISIAAIAVR